jgi:hypothetical protein
MTRVFGRVDLGMTGSCLASGTWREGHRAERGRIVRRSEYEQRTAMSQSGHGFLAAPPSRAGCAAGACRAVVVTPSCRNPPGSIVVFARHRSCVRRGEASVKKTWYTQEQQVVASGARAVWNDTQHAAIDVGFLSAAGGETR